MTDDDKLREALHWARGCKDHHPHSIAARHLITLCAAAESTLPKTKMVDVWRVESAVRISDGTWHPVVYCFFTAERAAAALDEEAITLNRAGLDEAMRCIRVTGPHTQEVPA